MHTFTILGARGSLFSGAGADSRYGQRTTCMALKTPQGVLVIDAGTGLPAALGPASSPGLPPPPVTILFTHYHIDHLAGLSLFPALYDSGATICLRGAPQVAWRAALQRLVAPPYWPVELLACGASIELRDLPLGPAAVEVCGVKVTWCPVFHPQECLAYRLEMDGRSYVVATDREQGHPAHDSNFLRFCKGADFLIHDAQYLPEEYPRRIGWGHSTFSEAAAVARAAGVGRLILTHHEARRTDAQIDQILERARSIFKDTEAAMEGMCLQDV
jgi:ribonuclease BN (tRNA processing enzyme)